MTSDEKKKIEICRSAMRCSRLKIDLKSSKSGEYSGHHKLKLFDLKTSCFQKIAKMDISWRF